MRIRHRGSFRDRIINLKIICCGVMSADIDSVSDAEEVYIYKIEDNEPQLLYPRIIPMCQWG